MGEHNFTEEDKLKFVDFLNSVARHAKFEMNTEELIKYFKLLSHMQTKIMPKIDANILQVKKVIESKDKPVEG